ncbi:MAG: DUF1961 family protein [Bacteroidota bacterium]
MNLNRRAYLKTAFSALGGAVCVPLLSRGRFIQRGESDTSSDMNTLIYENPFSHPDDVADFILEGSAHLTFERQRLRMQNALPLSAGKRAHFVFWCPEDFPGQIRVTWDFYPIEEPGLAMLFFGAANLEGGSIFDPSLSARDGQYKQYHSGELNTYHISYFRRKQVTERAFHICNLRKSKGFHSVATGADPIPSVVDAQPPYRMELVKDRGVIRFSINELPVLHWTDDGSSYGPILGGGKIGFRQMAPLVVEYANFKVYTS